MGHKKYRICLLMVAVAATLGGILYYCFEMKEEKMKEKGTLVKQMQQTGETIKEAGQNVKNDVKEAFSHSGKTIKETAGEVRTDMEDMAKAVKEDMGNMFSGIKDQKENDHFMTGRDPDNKEKA